MVESIVTGLRSPGVRWAWLYAAALAAALQLGSTHLSFAAPEPDDAWPSLANEVFQGRPLADGTGLVGIEMPARAEDAAVVPVTHAGDIAAR